MKDKRSWLLVLGGILIGVLIIMAIRFFTYDPHRTHYHANFAMFINGQQEQFKDDFYYEEVGSACTATEDMTPHDRAHMHEHEAGLVHVHDNAVTWGQFFQNIGWEVNPWYVKTPKQLLLADGTHKVSFLVNGKPIANVTGLVIGDTDKLLVDYGDGSAESLNSEMQAIPSNAAKEDAEKDPSSCSGSAPVTTTERLHHLF